MIDLKEVEHFLETEALALAAKVFIDNYSFCCF